MDRDQDLLRCGPLRLQLILVHTLLQDPAQTRHGLHPVEQSWVLGRVFVTLREQNDNGSIRTSAEEPKTSPPVCGDGTTRMSTVGTVDVHERTESFKHICSVSIILLWKCLLHRDRSQYDL